MTGSLEQLLREPVAQVSAGPPTELYSYEIPVPEQRRSVAPQITLPIPALPMPEEKQAPQELGLSEEQLRSQILHSLRNGIGVAVIAAKLDISILAVESVAAGYFAERRERLLARRRPIEEMSPLRRESPKPVEAKEGMSNGGGHEESGVALLPPPIVGKSTAQNVATLPRLDKAKPIAIRERRSAPPSYLPTPAEIAERCDSGEPMATGGIAQSYQ